MPPAELSCREFVDFLSDYADGALEGEARESFEAHLGECPDCVAYLASFRETLQLARECGAEPEETPGAAPPELVDAVLAARRTLARGPR